ncbi:monocyte to macrophage differentiation factor-like isoform X2 [Mytilus trossulus]
MVVQPIKTRLSCCDFTRLKNPKAGKGQAYIPTDYEHIANIVTHGMMIIPSMFGTWWMVCIAKTKLQTFIAWIFGFALISLFTTSSLFHLFAFMGECKTLKYIFHIGDRAVIYLFIASSYTPWLTLREFNGIGDEVLSIVWTMAVVGILYQYIFHEKYKILELLLYLIIGVCPAIVVCLQRQAAGMFELALGGATYILGVVFFKMDGRMPFAHAIWHCFVAGGALWHYYAICTHLLGHDHDELAMHL